MAHPVIVSETGRAVTAQHSCIISKVVDVIDSHSQVNFKIEKNSHNLVLKAKEIYDYLTEKNIQEVYNDTIFLKESSLNAFRLGILNLEDYSVIESIINKTQYKILNYLKELKDSEDDKSMFIPESLEDLEERIAPKYLCNFSVFQSVPDHWAIGQILPIVPIQRLNEEPDQRCRIVDITCDSDGKIKSFIDSGEIKKTISLHTLKKKEDYYIGIFLTGAYQDVMGDNHNLFGRLNELHVFSNEKSPDFLILNRQFMEIHQRVF